MELAYCSTFREWEKTDRKQPPPCNSCAIAASLVRRAKEYEEWARARHEEAARLLREAHG